MGSDGVELTRDQVVGLLVQAGNPADRAIQYADAYLEYREASANLAEFGAVVSHPRTGNPVENPYLKVRDGALRKLSRMRDVVAFHVWELDDGATA